MSARSRCSAGSSCVLCWHSTALLLSLQSAFTIPERKPDILFEQLLLQFNVGRSHKRLLALHHHLQHLPIQERDIAVLQL